MPASIEVPDEDIVAEPNPQVNPAPEPAAQTPPEPAAVATLEPAAGDPAAPPVPETPQYTGLADYAKELGVDFGSQFTDDRSLFQALLTAYQSQQQFQGYQRPLEEYMQHAGEFRAWRAEQEQAKAKPAKGPWEPPAQRDEVQRLLAAYYERDAQTGQLKARPDTPLDAKQKVEQYGQYVQEWQHKLQHDPLSALQPMIEHMVQPLLQKQLEQQTEQMQARDMIRRNQGWLYQQGPDGQVRHGQDGKPVLSREGQIFGGFIQRGVQLGIKGLEQQEQYALERLQTQLMIEKEQQVAQPAAAVANGAASRAAAVQRGNRRPNVGTPALNGVVPQPGPEKGLGMREMLTKAFAAEGITDATLAAEYDA